MEATLRAGVLVGIALASLATVARAQQEATTGEVRAHEVAFAKTMADRDFEAFLAFVSPEAVFFGSGGALRGKDAIAGAWRPYFEEPSPPFSWEPDVVEVLDSGALALTSGPVRDPAGEVVGRFNSIWRREPGGQWRVVFDRGS